MRVAVVGHGKMGRLYDSLLGASYLVDPHIPAGRDGYFSVEEFVSAGPEVDLVVVASPTELHYEHADQLLEAGYNLLVEKPICLTAADAGRLEVKAREKGLVLFQSCLERYNPAVKFLARRLRREEVLHVESFRYSPLPERHRLQDPKFDLAIHDLDLWFHLFERSVPWALHAGYGPLRREIVMHMKDGRTILADLATKQVQANGITYELGRASPNNPILEMAYDVFFEGRRLNEAWHREILMLERQVGSEFQLDPPGRADPSSRAEASA